ncbi:MAG: Uma2 family endonuclease [Planctomycetaceae bacterium]|nr:Uma2 family endonuclease [Planctomycetaceae bacterium]
MALTSKLMTADELFVLPDHGMRHELVRGELRTMAPAGHNHGDIGSELLLRLRSHAKANGLGKVVGPDTGYLLSRDPDNVRAPDVSFVRLSRLPPLPVNTFFPGAPDRAVEILSPSDTVEELEELEEKLADYFAAGTLTVWIVKPRTKSIDILGPAGLIQSLKSEDTLTAPDLLPGFMCKVAEIFA